MRRFMWSLVVVVGSIVVVPAAQAQMPIIPGAPVVFDKARLSGFFWRTNVDGGIGLRDIGGIPDFNKGIDFVDDLGLSSGAFGYFLEANVAPHPRHRFIIDFSGTSHSATQPITISLPGSTDVRNAIAESKITFRDISGVYNFLFVQSTGFEAGVLLGVGYFNSDTTILVASLPGLNPPTDSEILLDAVEPISSAYPVIGGNLRLISDDLITIGTDFSGFPSVTIGALSGWQLDWKIVFEVYPTDNLGITAGYRRFQLSLENSGTGLDADYLWDGFVMGVQYRWR